MSTIRFGMPAALFLLALLPVATTVARRRAIPRGPLLLRLLIFTLVIAALASPSLPAGGGDLSVVFAVDHSDSIPADQLQAAQAFVRTAAAHRRPGDRIGLVTFGANAITEELPNSSPRLAFTTHPISTGTDLGLTIRTALAALPPEGARRIVVLTDGNDNRGTLADALALARSEGVEVSTVPLIPGGQWVVLVDEVAAPADVVVGEQFAVKVAVLATAAVRAHLTLSAGNVVVDRRTIDLQPGRTIITVPQVARTDGMLSYEAVVTTEPPTTEAATRGQAVVLVRGTPLVWYVAHQPGVLPQLLAAQGARVRNLSPEALPVTATGFRGTSVVILDDVPANQLSLAQMAALRDYVGRQGGGLIAVGGPHSFGVGDYAGTPLEEVLPVSMDVRHRLAIPSMATILVMDASGSMGPYGSGVAKIDLAKETAQSVIDLLGDHDLVGVVVFDQEPHWLVTPTEARNRDQVMDLVSRLQAGGGTNILPAIRMAYTYLRRSQARLRHVILLSDGLTDPDDYRTLLTKMRAEKITTSTVAIGPDADLDFMKHLAAWGGGQFHATTDLSTIPQISTGEAVIASRAYLVEESFTPQAVRPGMVDDFALPSLRGYVATSPKPAAAVHLVSAQDDPILATWQFGLGRAVAFTSDATARWAAAWMRWTDVGRFWSRLARWASLGEADDLQVAVDRDGETATVIADAVTPQGSPLDGMEVQAGITGPISLQVPLVQVAPGRYEARVPVTAVGAYSVAVTARDQAGRVRVKTSGFVVPHSPELTDLTVNRALLAQIVEATGGHFLADPAAAIAPGHGTHATVPVWPTLAGAALGLFVVEITVRRIPAILQHLAVVMGGVRSRLTAPPTSQEVDEERQYAEADRWKFVEPDAAASESMEQAARLYIARLKAAQKEGGRRRGSQSGGAPPHSEPHDGPSRRSPRDPGPGGMT